MPYGISKSKGGDSPENIKKMEKCILAVKKTGKDENSAIAICKSSLFGEGEISIDKDTENLIKGLNFNETKYLFEMGEFKEVNEGDTIDIQIMRTGQWKHPVYGQFKVTVETLDEVVKNFEENKRGVDLAIDENHEPDHKALGRIRRVYKASDDSLFATIELTKRGSEVISQGLYKYFSPEIIWETKDDETGDKVKNLLIGGAFTNRPYFKNMKGIMASEVAIDDNNNSYILSFKENESMNKFKEILEKLAKETKISAVQFSELKGAFDELSADEQKEVETKVTEVEAKVEKADDNKGDDNKGDNEGDKKDEGDNEGDKTVKANEGTITITAEQFAEFKNLSSVVSKLTAEARRNSVTTKVEAMKFSETNKSSVILPKSVSKIVEFACSISEKQAEKFFEILGDFKDISEKFEEKGHGNDAGEFKEADMQAKIKTCAEKYIEKGMDSGEAYKKARKECMAEKC